MAALPLRALYHVAELAKALGMDRRKLRRHLVKTEVPVRRLGKCWIVYLSDLETYASPIWGLLVAAAKLRHARKGRKRTTSDI